MVKFAPNFCYCAVDQEKAVFQWKRVVSGPSAILGPEMVKFAWNFYYCAVDQEKAVLKRKRVVSGPSAILGPEMVKFAWNFCYCAVDQKNVVFQWKRTVSGPSAFLGLEMVKFAWNFCYCAVDQEKAVSTWKRAVLLCRSPRKGRSSMETGRFWPICHFGARKINFAPNFCYCAVDQEKAVSGPSALLGPKIRISAIVL